MPPDFKPFSKEQQLARPSKPARPSAQRQREMRERKQGPCRVCGQTGPNNLHHVLPRHYGLIAWTESNLIPLCGSGTTGCHGLVEAHDRAAVLAMARSLTNSEYAYVIDRGGEGFFERRYQLKYERAG